MTAGTVTSQHRDIFTSLVQWTIMIALGCVPVCAVLVAAQYLVSYPDLLTWVELPVLALSLLLWWWLYRYTARIAATPRTAFAVAFGVMNAAMIVSLLHYPTVVCSDYKVIYGIASAMADGRFVASEQPHYVYAYIFHYQTGISWLVSLSIRIFGHTLWPLKIFCLVLVNAAAWLTYKVGGKLDGDRTGRGAMLLFATYYPVLITVNQFTNQHIAAVMIYVTLLMLCSRRWYIWLLSGVLIATMNVLRPMGVILVLTALVWGIYSIWRGRSSRRGMLIPLGCVVALLAAYATMTAVYDHAFIAAGYTDTPISRNKLPLFKFDKGLTGYDFPQVKDVADGDIDRFNQWERDKLTTLAGEHPAQIASYVATKMIRYMGEWDWKFENTYDHDQEIARSYPVKAWVMMGWAQYLLLSVFALLGYRRWRRVHGPGPMQVFYAGITAVYIFIEAFSSYRYESYPLLMCFVAMYLAHNADAETDSAPA